MGDRCALIRKMAMEDRDLEDRKGDRLSHTAPSRIFKTSDEALHLARTLASPGATKMVALAPLGGV